MRVLNYVTSLLICLYIFILPLSPESVKLKGISISDISLFLIILVYLMSIILSSSSRNKFFNGIRDFFKDYLGIFMTILAAMMLFSITYALEKKLALSEALRFISYIILYFIIKYEITTHKMYEKILKSIIYVSLIIGILGIIQYYMRYNLADVYGIKRITSTMDNPNNLGAFLILTIFPVIMLAIYEKVKSRKIIYMFTTLILLVNIVLAGSRSSFLGFIVAGLIIVVFYNRNLLIPFGILGGLSLLIPAVGNRIRDIGNQTQNISRIKLWELASRMIKEHPIFGVGNGNFVSYYDIYVKNYPELESGWHRRYPVHNSYLKVTSELGIVGSISFLGILVCCIFNVRRLTNICEEKFFRTFYIGFFASMISFFFMNFTDNLFFVPKTTTFFWIMIAVCNSIRFNKNDKYFMN